MSTVARSTPYAWPYDGGVESSRLALIVVFPGAVGAEAAGDGDPAAVIDTAFARIGELAGSVTTVGGVVVEVITTPPTRRGAPVPRRVAMAGLDVPTHRITSGGVDGFFASPLDATLRALGRDQLLLCGLWLETGVHSTMRSANDRGYECLLVFDASVPYDPELAPAARSQIEMSGGIFGAVGETGAVLDALGSPEERQSERTSA